MFVSDIADSEWLRVADTSRQFQYGDASIFSFRRNVQIDNLDKRRGLNPFRLRYIDTQKKIFSLYRQDPNLSPSIPRYYGVHVVSSPKPLRFTIGGFAQIRLRI